MGDNRMSTEERARTVWVPIELQSAATQPVDATWTIAGLTAEPGSTSSPGTLASTFARARSCTTCPVQVLDDDDTAAELLTVRLLGASGDVPAWLPPARPSWPSPPTGADLAGPKGQNTAGASASPRPLRPPGAAATG